MWIISGRRPHLWGSIFPLARGVKDYLTDRSVIQFPGFMRRTPRPSALNTALAGRWFATQVGVRLRTLEEMKALRKKSLPGVEVPDQELTDRTFSLAFDPGVYFGESLRSAYPYSGMEAIS